MICEPVAQPLSVGSSADRPSFHTKYTLPAELKLHFEDVRREEDIIEAGREMDYRHPDRPDKVMAMLAAVNQAVITRNDAKRWEAGMSVMEHAARYDLDVALAGARPLARSVKDAKGARLSAEFVQRLFPRIQRALED